MSYVPIRISTLAERIKLGFDIYIKLPSKYLLYYNKEDDLDTDSLSSLKKRKIRKLYILGEQEGQYQEFLDRCLVEVMQGEGSSLEEKSELLAGVTVSGAEQVLKDPSSEKSYNKAKKISGHLIQILDKNDELLKNILGRESELDSSLEEKMHIHAANTSMLAIKLAEMLNLSKEEQELLGIAGLFHDIGFIKIDSKYHNLFFKNMSEFSAEELTAYKKHPELGADLIQDKSFASKELIDLIITHEERESGNGFPNKLKSLSVMQEVLALCCHYDRRVTCLGEEAQAVIKDFMIGELGNFKIETLKSFKKLMKTLI